MRLLKRFFRLPVSVIFRVGFSAKTLFNSSCWDPAEVCHIDCFVGAKIEGI